MTYHGLLDWRLAISYLKILFDINYKAGLDGNFNSPELQGWLETSIKLRDSFISYFNYQPVMWGSLPGFIAGPRTAPRKFIVVHPLWNCNSLSGILAEATAAAGGRVDDYIDTFNLLRRPGWCRTSMAGTGG